MATTFISRIRKGNKRGTGFLPIPKAKLTLFRLSDKVQIKFLNNVYFFAQIIEYSHKLGVYVPKNLMTKYRLLDKKVEIQIKKIKGFYASVASDGRLYLPRNVVENESLRNNDIVCIEVMGNITNFHRNYKNYAKIYVASRPQRKRKEFMCYLNKIFANKIWVFKLKKLSKVIQNEKITSPIFKVLRDANYAFVNHNTLIVFKHKVPALVNSNIKYSNLAFYLGAYFADGTKRGNSWAISASTFEQAKYYLKMHNLLIKDSKPEFVISYTNIYNSDITSLKRKLAKIWRSKVGIKVEKFRIRKPKGKLVSKWNKYGTLVIREHRQILLDVYNILVKSLIEEIISKQDKKLAIDFLCGVMEGDGCAPAKNRGHIMIATNENDISFLENILKVAQIKFKTSKASENKYTLKIGALEILRNFHQLKDRLFILYPKRRKTFFERLKTVGATKFLLENHSSTNWGKALLRNYGFCDENYQLTSKGLKLRNELIANINKAVA